MIESIMQVEVHRASSMMLGETQLDGGVIKLNSHDDELYVDLTNDRLKGWIMLQVRQGAQVRNLIHYRRSKKDRKYLVGKAEQFEPGELTIVLHADVEFTEYKDQKQDNQKKIYWFKPFVYKGTVEIRFDQNAPELPLSPKQADSLKRQLAKLKNEADQLRQTCQALEAKGIIADLRISINHLQDEIKQLTAQKCQDEADVQALQTTLAGIAEQQKDYEQQVSAADADVKAKKQQIKKLKAEMQQKTEEVEQVKSDIAAMDQRRTELTSLGEEAERLRQQEESLRDEIEQCQTREKALREKLKKAKKTEEDLNKKKQQADELEKVTKELEDKKRKFQQDSKAFVDEVCQVLDGMEKQNEIKRLSREIRSLSTWTMLSEDLKRRIQDVQQRISQLEADYEALHWDALKFVEQNQ